MRSRTEWKLVSGIWISTQPVLPGVWRHKEGGCYVRGRVVDPTTGKKKDFKKVLQSVDPATALKWLNDEKANIRAGGGLVEAPRTRFAEFAKSLFERKVKTREIRSAKGRAKWAAVLEHLIAGTTGKKSEKFVPGFGEFFLDKLLVSHVEAWRSGIADLIQAGEYSPTTCNGWLSVLRVVLKAASRELGLPRVATEGVKDFDESEHETYTEEEPNALLPDEAPVFLNTLRELFPQHYAMVFLGLVTGLRPSSLRPLRRRGPSADVLWDERKLLVRRSHSLGDEVMNTTKQRVKYRIHLPAEVIEVLQWHVETQLVTPEQRESDLLFPAVTGGFRSPSVLNKPFAAVAEAVGLGKRFTQRGLRRTFNDLARVANVEAVVKKSISGHSTDRMVELYSTVNATEQRDGLAKVIQFVSAKDREPALPSGRDGGSDPAASGKKEKAG